MIKGLMIIVLSAWVGLNQTKLYNDLYLDKKECSCDKSIIVRDLGQAMISSFNENMIKTNDRSISQ